MLLHGAGILRDTLGKEQPVSKDEVPAPLQAYKTTLAQRIGVAGLVLFSSFARDQTSEGSDVDILVRFDGPATSKRCFGT